MRVLQVKNGSFTSLFFSINGEMGKEVSKCFSRIAEMLSEKLDKPYSLTMSWILKETIIFLIEVDHYVHYR